MIGVCSASDTVSTWEVTRTSLGESVPPAFRAPRSVPTPEPPDPGAEPQPPDAFYRVPSSRIESSAASTCRRRSLPSPEREAVVLGGENRSDICAIPSPHGLRSTAAPGIEDDGVVSSRMARSAPSTESIRSPDSRSLRKAADVVWATVATLFPTRSPGPRSWSRSASTVRFAVRLAV